MKVNESLKPSKGVFVLFLILFLSMFYLALPFFSSCKTGGIACSSFEPQSLCERRNTDYRRNCENYIITLAIFFLVISYLISSQVIYAFRKSKVGLFISHHFWEIFILSLIFLVLSSMYYNEPLVIDAFIMERGWPLPYWRSVQGTWGFEHTVTSEIIYPYLVLDFIFWYLISAVLVFVKNKQKVKNYLD
jgi:hypothetical protein